MPVFKRPSSIREPRGASMGEDVLYFGAVWSKISSNKVLLRVTLGLLLYSGFALVISLGHIYTAILLLGIISTAYYELVSLYDKVIERQKEDVVDDDASAALSPPGRYKKRMPIYVITKAFDLLSFISLETYFLLATMFGISCPWLLPRVARMHPKVARICAYILSYHHLLLFLSYLAGIIKFILALERGRSRQQFLRFAFIIMSLLYVVLQSVMIIANLYYGMIWVLLPHSMVILNDVMAYVFGKIYGKTPLISLSPNKTLEGFIGAFFSTSLIIALTTPACVSFTPLVCPVNNFDFTPFAWLRNTCEPASIYKAAPHVLPDWAVRFVGVREIVYKPCFVHIMILTLFASFLAPFGGFLASGFKRALKIKDFGDTIPGHGGMMDRFDCHIMMCSFTYLYLKTFVRRVKYNPEAVMKVISRMTPEDRTILIKKITEVFGR